ncbi:MAG: SRPBCC family protein [Flavobacteriaceae bacterium]|nr:SRPBCC family protein [Flavobacteriaceae bacterium]
MLFVYILAIIIAVFIILAAAAPKKYRVSREIDINRPQHEVYDYLKYVKNQNNWGPWAKRDPNMKQTYIGTDGTIGFVSRWESDHKQVGAGEQEIIKLEDNKRMESELRFLKPWKSISYGFLVADDNGDGTTKVTWGFYGTNKIPFNIMMLFFNMDKAVGKDFEEGLADLKQILEN